VAEPALPVELDLAVGVALGEALAAARLGELVHRARGQAQPLVGAALAPMALPDGVRDRAPAVPRGALPFHRRQAVDVGFGHATTTKPGGVALDFFERQLAHRFDSSGCDAGSVAPGAAAPM